MKHKCGYEDCFSCPFKDCVVKDTDPADPNPSDFLDIKPRVKTSRRRKEGKHESC